MSFSRTAYHQPPQQDEDVYPEDLKTAYEPEPHLETIRRSDFTLKRNIRVLKLLVRLATLSLASYGVVSQALVLHTYLTTQPIVRDGGGPWAAETQLWPTIVLLSTSALTVIVSLTTIGSYCMSVKAANEVHNKAGTTSMVVEWCAHLAVWIATAVAYRVGKTGKDLWGWSCSTAAQDIQKTFPEVNFDFLCSFQSGSWIISIAQAALAITTVTVWILAHQRKKQKKIIRNSMNQTMAQ